MKQTPEMLAAIADARRQVTNLRKRIKNRLDTIERSRRDVQAFQEEIRNLNVRIANLGGRR